MPEHISRPRKPKKSIVIAIQAASWPAWMPRPAITQQAPDDSNPAAAEIESELPSVAEVRSQAPKAPSAGRSRASDADGDSKKDGQAATRAEQVALIKIIGARLREAREELAGLSQQQAAVLLGYSNGSKLAKIEGASDTNSVPLLTILRAAKLYQVSIDFLFGAADDWERDPQLCRERAIGRWLFEYLDKARKRDAAAFAELAHRVETATTQIGRLADGAEQSISAFNKFRDINPGYEDMIGGARLQAALEALDEAGRQARLQLRRLHLELSGDRVSTMEPSHG